MPFKTLIQPLLRAVQSRGYTTPTAIQTLAIPHVLDGKDLLGCAQTGTGKTAAFALPILQRLHRTAAARPDARGGRRTGGGARPIRSLVLTPTRELAAQVGDSFGTYGRHSGLRHAVVFGGVNQRGQVDALRRGVDVLVATPGRLLDLLGQKLLSLAQVEIFVLDEADRMLDMGFIHDIRRVIAHLPARRQTLLFSATLPREIRSLAGAVMTDPVHVAVPAASPAADTVDQVVYHVPRAAKIDLLRQLLDDPRMDRTLVFTRTKHGADKVVRQLVKWGLSAQAIHSNKSQNARVRALESFRGGKTRILVASDIAARGLDVDGITHVVNFDLPHESETYVHRIGRTGRAGASGQAVSFCCDDERDDLRQIERLLGRAIPVRSYAIAGAAEASGDARPPRAGTSAARKGGSQQPRRTAATGESKQQAFWRHRRRRRKTSSPGAGRSGRRGV